MADNGGKHASYKLKLVLIFDSFVLEELSQMNQLAQVLESLKSQPTSVDNNPNFR